MQHSPFARLRDSIRHITHQGPSAYKPPDDPKQQQPRRSLDSALNADPEPSAIRLGFVKAFRRASSDFPRSQLAKDNRDNRELEARRIREDRKERERLAKENDVLEQRSRQEKVKAQRAAEQSHPPSSPQPSRSFQQPTLSKGSMSTPSLQLNDSPRHQRQPNPPLSIRVSASASSSHLPFDSPPASPTRHRAVSPPPIPKASATRPLTRHPNTSAPTLPSSPSALRPIRTRTPSPTPQVPRDPELQSLIQIASRILLKHLLVPKSPDCPMSSSRERQLAEVEARLRSLARLEQRFWRESASPTGPVSAGDERERRYFVEALRDGYILCVFMNAILPSRTLPIKPNISNPSNNISRFLTHLQFHFQTDSSSQHIPAFLPDDLEPSSASAKQSQAYWDGLKRVANCIISMGQVRESLLQSRQRSSSPSPGTRHGIYQRHGPAIMSSPDLTLARAQTPASPTKVKKATPPSPKTAQPPPSEPPDQGKGKQKQVINEPIAVSDEVTNRTSVSTNATTATYLSSLFTVPDRNYGTVKTMVTDLSSASGGTSSKAEDVEEGVRRRRRVSEVGIPVDLSRVAEAEEEDGLGSIQGKVLASRQDRKEASPQGRNRNNLNIHLGKGKWPDDFMDVFSSTPPSSPGKSQSAFVSTRKAKADEDVLEHSDSEDVKPMSRSSPIPIPLAPRRELASSPNSSPRRALRLRRPSAGSPSPNASVLRSHSPTAEQSPQLRDDSPISFARRVPLGLTTPINEARRSTSPAGLRPRQRTDSTSSSKELPEVVQKAPSESLPSAGLISGALNAPKLTTRRYSANASLPSASATPAPLLKSAARYAPRPLDSTNQTDSISIPIPFPRRSSGEHPRHGHHQSISVLPALPSSSETLVTLSSSQQTIDTVSQKPTRPTLSRGRFQSEGMSGTETLRIKAAQEADGLTDEAPQPQRPRGRGRTESMVNLGAEQSVGSMIRDRTGAVSNGVRLTVTLKERGTPPVHYQLGNCIGRGQFGTVYRALNLNTGQTVAIKRISLAGLSDSEITQLMNEVELLKRLSHPSIVKYEGMVRDTDTLSIVLEYVENGSLLHTLKAFGRLNDRLVASYVIKILEGLCYLHQSEVVHCDLKSANILTTKNGNVKLSDFGVSLNLRAMENIKDNVAGTPNWMAPEIIELKGASPASDIWSLGCTVVELLTGKPPYADISNAMTVMFRIVDDEKPPIPEICSGPIRDFLLQCFQKNPLKRPTAEQLFEHPWVKMSWDVHKDLRPQDSLPFFHRVSAEIQRAEFARSAAESQDKQTVGISKRLSSDLRPTVIPADNEGALSSVGQHTFVKTHFSKAVLCRVCDTAVKSRAMLCQDCSLVAHARCAESAPADCDVRVHWQLYARFSQELPSPAVTPLPSADPPTTSQTSAKQETAPNIATQTQTGLHKIFSRKRSKTNYADPPSPPSATNGNAEVSKRTLLFGKNRNSRGESQSRNSMGSEPTSSSLRSSGNQQLLVQNGSAGPHAGNATAPTPPPKFNELPVVPNGIRRGMPNETTTKPVESPDAKASSPDDQTYAKRRKRLTKSDSRSGCTTQ